MAKFRKRPVEVRDAVQWFPDETRGRFVYGKYDCRSTGYDCHGVEYTICDVGIFTRQGFMKIVPGDWIVTGMDGRKWVVEGELFADFYEPVFLTTVDPKATVELRADGEGWERPQAR